MEKEIMRWIENKILSLLPLVMNYLGFQFYYYYSHMLNHPTLSQFHNS